MPIPIPIPISDPISSSTAPSVADRLTEVAHSIRIRRMYCVRLASTTPNDLSDMDEWIRGIDEVVAEIGKIKQVSVKTSASKIPEPQPLISAFSADN